MKTPEPSAPQWRKSTYSGDTGGQCVELADAPGAILARDSKNPDDAVLTLSRSAFGALRNAL